MKWKILLVVALYITLGVIGYFSFGFHNLMIEKAGGKGRSDGTAWKKLEKNITTIQSDVPPRSRDSSSNQEAEGDDHQEDGDSAVQDIRSIVCSALMGFGRTTGRRPAPEPPAVASGSKRSRSRLELKL